MADDLQRLLAARLRERRRAESLAQADLAELAEVSTEFVSRLERGKTFPSVPTLMRLCEALRCTPNDLLLAEPVAGEAWERLRDRLAGARPAAVREALRAAEAMLEYSARPKRRRRYK